LTIADALQSATLRAIRTRLHILCHPLRGAASIVARYARSKGRAPSTPDSGGAGRTVATDNFGPIGAGARGALVLGALLGGSTAYADDVILVPEMQANTEIDPVWASDIQAIILQTLKDNGFVVLDAATVRRVAGDVLDRCAPSEQARCTRDALKSVPAAVGLQLLLSPMPEGGTQIGVEFYDEEQAEPIRQMTLPIEIGKERRLALQIAMFSLDVVNEVGPSSQGVIDAARAMVGGPRPIPQVTPDTIRVYGGSDDPNLRPEEPDEDLIEEDPDEDLSNPDSIEEEEPVEPIVKEKDVLPRYLEGSRNAYKARKEPAEVWYKKRSPHAGRLLLEVRGGFGHSDVNRQAYSLADTEPDGTVASIYYIEGPVKGIGARVDAFLGYAPATMFDFGVLVGAEIARDNVVLGLMEANEDPKFGAPERFTIGRTVVQPRFRAWLVQLGPVKPYLAAGLEFKFVSAWTFDVEGDLPLSRPPGGLIYSVVGGLGLAFDPHPRVGVLLGGDLHYHLGALSKTRAYSSSPDGPVGNAFPTATGSGFTILPTLGLQIRL
jgi:hypothetical protein